MPLEKRPNYQICRQIGNLTNWLLNQPLLTHSLANVAVSVSACFNHAASLDLEVW